MRCRAQTSRRPTTCKKESAAGDAMLTPDHNLTGAIAHGNPGTGPGFVAVMGGSRRYLMVTCPSAR